MKGYIVESFLLFSIFGCLNECAVFTDRLYEILDMEDYEIYMPPSSTLSVSSLAECIIKCPIQSQSTCELVVFNSETQICDTYRRADMKAQSGATVHPNDIVALLNGSSCMGAYLGCFQDDRGGDMHAILSGNNTPDKCMTACSAAGFMYAGSQYAYQCFCGNMYGKGGVRPESECNMPCNGDSSQICGGPGRNSIYRTDLNCTHV